MKNYYLLLLFTVSAIMVFSAMDAPAKDIEGLVFYFSFDEQVPIDHSANPTKVANITGNLKLADGKFGKAGDFDGSTFIEVAHADKLEGMVALTIEAWIKLSKATESGSIASKRVANLNADVYNLFVYTGTKLDGRVNHSGDFWSTTVFKVGDWYHVAYIFDGKAANDQKQRMYVNGVLESKATHASASVDKGGASLWIGELDSSRGFKFTGLIDELGIWNIALSEDQINQVMTVGKVKMQPVEPSAKLATTWGNIKN